VTSFVTAAGEISETILLTSRESLAPMSYGIYLYMQSISGRGPGAALGVIAVLLIGLGTWLTHRVAARHARHDVKGSAP
jgi:iron(III) transport system permease protein